MINLNDESVIKVRAKLDNLTHEELKYVFHEYKTKTDVRFGDNLLVCLSNIEFNGSIDQQVESTDLKSV